MCGNPVASLISGKAASKSKPARHGVELAAAIDEKENSDTYVKDVYCYPVGIMHLFLGEGLGEGHRATIRGKAESRA